MDASASASTGRATDWSEWHRHWRLVVSAFSGSALASVYSYSIGVTIVPIEQEFGWSRAQITSGLFIVSLFSVTFSLFMGMVIDRFGPRRIAIGGIALHCTALALLSQAGPSIVMWWAQWALIAVSILFIKPTVWVTAISSTFHLTRGLAFGVVLSATGLISFAIPSITLKLITAYDWRTTYLLLGVSGAAVTLPLVYFWFKSDADHRHKPAATNVQNPKLLTGFTVKQGLASANFYILGAAGFFMSFATVALTINMVPILISQRIEASIAALIAGALGLSQIVGRLGGGVMLDRFRAPFVAAVAVSLPVVTSLLLLYFPGQWYVALGAAITLGFAAGAEMDAVAFLCSKYFGLRKFATLFGAFSGILTLGFGIGPMAANMIYDATGSYDAMLWSIIPLSLISSILFLNLRPVPNFDETDISHNEMPTKAISDAH